MRPTASRALVAAADRKLATLNHPDKGRDEELMKRLTRARLTPPQPIPTTGSDPVPPGAAALVAVAIGAGLVMLTRRRAS